MLRFKRIAAVSALFPATLLFAATLKLTDGTSLDGDVKKLGSSYMVKQADGTTRIVSANDVASIDDPTGQLTLPTTGTPAAGDTTSTPAGGTHFVRAKQNADRCDEPLLAVTLWQKFIDDHPKSPDLPAAKKEMQHWQDMQRDGAEKVKGKWVVGDDLKKLHEQVASMMKEAIELMQSEQTLKAINKLQDVIRLYPNSFEANFELGYYYLVKGGNDQYDKAISSLEAASKLNPASPECLSNLAIAYNFRRRFQDAVVTSYKAVQIEDSEAAVQNLVNAISYAPPGMRTNNPKVRPIVDEAKILAGRHNISGPSGKWTYLRPRPHPELKEGGDNGAIARKGIIGSGTGFFISSDGYLLTNRHVAAAGDKMIIRMADGTQKVAEKVVIDDDQDIAILHIKSDTPLPFIKLAAYDEPPVGTDVTVLGFPLGAMLGTNVKITRGVVTSVEETPAECDVIVDAQVNPGNSGGPMLDKYGNLMAMTSMKTLSDTAVSSYGLGISTKRLRKFFDHQKDKLTAIKLTAGQKGAMALSTEDIAGEFTNATVMVLVVAGDLPEGLK